MRISSSSSTTAASPSAAATRSSSPPAASTPTCTSGSSWKKSWRRCSIAPEVQLMRLVITGGSGLIGTAVAREMGGAGHEVVVLSRDPSRVTPLPPNTRAVYWEGKWDGRTAGDWAKLLDADTAVVHLAGDGVASGRWTDEKKRRIRASRIDSGGAVLAAIRQAKTPPRVLLQGSAVGYYGDCGDEVVEETHPPGDDFLARVC